MDKKELINKAFDQSTVDSKLITLNEEQATQFIDMVRDESKILKAARVVTMSKPIKTIAKIVDSGEFLKPGGRGKNLSTADAGTDFGSDTIELVTKEVNGKIRILDEDLEDNIDGTGITQHLLSILTKKIANEFEIAGMLGIKKDQQNRLIDMFDGVRKLVADNGNVVDATSSALFGSDVRKILKSKFTKAFKSLPTKYRTEDLQFFAASDTLIDYNDLFDANYNRAEMVSGVLGKPIVEVPLMPIDAPVPSATASTTTSGTSAKGQKVVNVTASTNFAQGQTIVIGLGTKYQMVREVASTDTGKITVTVDLDQDIPSAAQTVTTCTLDGTDVILTSPKNIIYGIQKQGMSFETARVPNIGWDYYYKARIDFQVEEPLAAVLLKNLKNS